MITISRQFDVDGYACTLTSGLKDGLPLVVFGLRRLPFSQLSNITIEYPMKTLKQADRFVVLADDDVIRRGIEKYENEFQDVANRVNAALERPYEPDLGYVRRG